MRFFVVPFADRDCQFATGILQFCKALANVSHASKFGVMRFSLLHGQLHYTTAYRTVPAPITIPPMMAKNPPSGIRESGRLVRWPALPPRLYHIFPPRPAGETSVCVSANRSTIGLTHGVKRAAWFHAAV